MSDIEANRPDLSVVVTVVEGGISLERCLTALAAQTTSPYSMEVLVPYDHITPEVAAFAVHFPEFIFVDLGKILAGIIPKNALELHKFYDARRSAALKISQGRLVSMLEDRGVPAPDWAATMVEMHEKRPDCAVIGGAVENGVNKSLNWAVFISDFGRYQPPLADSNPEYISDTNICYKRASLESVREFWAEQLFDEAHVNSALRKNGKKLMLSDKPRTLQVRQTMSMVNMLRERYYWGRNFGQKRAQNLARKTRLKLCLGMSILPFYLYARHFRRQISKGHFKQFIIASPALFFLLLFWAIGEFVGYVEGRPAERYKL